MYSVLPVTYQCCRSFQLFLRFKRFTVPLSAEWKMLKDLHQTRSDNLFYVDREFIHSRLVEITILNSAGLVVLNTTVIHAEKTWPHIVAEFDGTPPNWALGYLRRLGFNVEYNPPAGRSMIGSEIRAILLRSDYK